MNYARAAETTTSIVVVSFVFELGLHAFVALTCIATFGGLERVLMRARSVRDRHGQQSLQLGRAARGTNGNGCAAHQGFKLVVARFAGEVVYRHGMDGWFVPSIHRSDR